MINEVNLIDNSNEALFFLEDFESKLDQMGEEMLFLKTLKVINNFKKTNYSLLGINTFRFEQII